MVDAHAPVILDVDHSVGKLPGARRIPLGRWQEAIRFGCRVRTLRAFEAELARAMPERHGTVFMGSGDFHHLSWPLIARMQASEPFQVVVFDNHPDNMRYPFGVHCGSWVRRVAALPRVRHVHVLGITSADIGWGHAWENYLTPLLRRKLTYWSMDVDVRWAHRLGLGRAFRNLPDPDALVAAFARELATASYPTYLSIDKDVFDPATARTNWDQGRLQLAHALALIAALPAPLVGSDVNGEISRYVYQSAFKRRLSALDQQPEVDPAQLAQWQAQQHALNLQLLAAIRARS